MQYIHCLRSQFTENILTHLLDGISVNVVIPIDGAGRKRFVHDVEQCQLPDNTRLLTVNMRVCRADYSQFLRQLWQQCQKLPSEVDLLGILSDLKQSEQHSILVLDNFDAMSAKDVDAHFNQRFYENLNGLKSYPNVSLLLITQQRYDEMKFYMEGELRTSKLDIQNVEILPPLLYDEVFHELKHRHEKLWYVRNLSDEHISHLLKLAEKTDDGYNYALLHFLLQQISNYAGSLEEISLFVKQLKRWHKKYKKLQISHWNYRLQKKLQETSALTSDLTRSVFSDWKVVLIEKLSDLFKRGK